MERKEPLLDKEYKTIPWNEVKNNINMYDVPSDCIKVPIGVTDYGNISYAILDSGDEYSHVLIIGQAGSGKSYYVRWILAALTFGYWNGVIINYIDGKGTEIEQFLKSDGSPQFFNSGVVKKATTMNDLRSALRSIVTRINLKDNKFPEVVVFDDISHLIKRFGEVDKESFKFILEEGPKKNIHVVLAEQSFTPMSDTLEYVDNLLDWQAICITKTDIENALLLQGSIMAHSNVRKYGDVIIKCDDSLQLQRIPTVCCKDMEELFS